MLDVLGGTPALLLRRCDVQPRAALLTTEAGQSYVKVSPGEKCLGNSGNVAV